MEAGRLTKEETKPGGVSFKTIASSFPEYTVHWTDEQLAENVSPIYGNVLPGASVLPDANFLQGVNWPQYGTPVVFGPQEKRVVTHKGKDVFEVLWSAEVTVAKELKKAKVEDIRHIGLNCQSIS